MKGTHLGEFEELVLLTVGILHNEAYGLSIKQEIKARAKRNVNLSAIHAALYRLEEKGFVNARMGEASNKRGGKRKKLFTLTNYGIKTLKDQREMRDSFWTAIPNIAIKGSR